MLTPEEKRELLCLARGAIVRRVSGKETTSAGSSFPGLQQRTGLFVTLKVHEQLRGCIGFIESSRPLQELVQEVAVKAATEDPRFPPLTEDELAAVSIEVSILSPLRRVYSPDEVQVGQHGVLLEAGMNRGLLLPQVATQYGWNSEQFLDATARKAGLFPGAWQAPDAKLFVFTAEIVAEEVHDHSNPTL